MKLRHLEGKRRRRRRAPLGWWSSRIRDKCREDSGLHARHSGQVETSI